MSAQSRRTRSGGYTLFELLGYVALLMIIMNLSASVLIGTKRLHTLGTLALERNEAIEEVARDFREAAHDSTTAVDSVPGLPASPGALVLTSKAADGATRFRLWRSDGDGRLYLDVYDTRPDRTLALASRKVYSPRLKVLEFSVTRGPPTSLVALDIVVDNEGTLRTVPRTNRFLGALGAP